MEPTKKSNRVLIGIIIIIILLIIGAVYVWQSNKAIIDTNIPTESESITVEDSSELDALQKDLETTNIDVGANVIDSVQ